jgi:hypothetical protein
MGLKSDHAKSGFASNSRDSIQGWHFSSYFASPDFLSLFYRIIIGTRKIFYRDRQEIPVMTRLPPENLRQEIETQPTEIRQAFKA